MGKSQDLLQDAQRDAAIQSLLEALSVMAADVGSDSSFELCGGIVGFSSRHQDKTVSQLCWAMEGGEDPFPCK